MPVSRRSLRGAILIAIDLVLLVTLRPDWASLASDLRHPHDWVSRAGADHAAGILTAAGVWVCAAWLAVGLAIAVLTTAPGWVGELGRRLGRRLVPTAVLRIAGATLGISVSLGALAPGLAAASTVPSASAPASAPASASASSPAPQWPRSSAPAWPTTSPQPPAPSNTHLVRPGESLWTIAATTLAAAHPGQSITDQQIAPVVAAWYRANRDVIGANPALLHPGQQLLAPQPPA